MSGHSKWATTKRHKGLVDAKRGKIFSNLAKEITLAARESGGDPNSNMRLRSILTRARAANMPNDNIDRAIKKGTGEIPGVVYEEMVYEGYAPAGVSLIVEVTTDNKNRAVGEVRSTFTKNGGNMGSAGSVAFNFNRKGQILVPAEGISEDELMELALEAGAEDFKNNGDHYEIITAIADYDNVAKALEDKGYIVRQGSKSRSMSITDKGAVSKPKAARRTDDSRDFATLPLVGRVAAGSPILAEQNIEEQIKLPIALVGDKNSFLLTVKGDSMIEAGIFDGDIVIVREGSSARNGDIVVAMLEDGATVKTFYQERDCVRLQPQNPALEPIFTRDAVILGTVTGLFRSL